MTLRSPKKETLEATAVEDRLQLTLGSDRKSILVKNDRGGVVGSVVVPEQTDLIKCLKAGHKFGVKVLSIKSGACVVEIFPERG